MSKMTWKRCCVWCLSVTMVAGLVYGAVWHWRLAPHDERDTLAASTSVAPPSKTPLPPATASEKVSLPHDFAFHMNYRHEWWRYVANVQDRNGNHYGVQWTFIRAEQGDKPNVSAGWQNSQLYIVQTVVTSQDKIWEAQRFARGGIGQAGMQAQKFKLWLDNWSWQGKGDQPLPGRLSVSTDHFSFGLRHQEQNGWIIPGDHGYQLHYERIPLASYSVLAPEIPVSGTLTLDSGVPFNVRGTAWLEKSWGDNLMEADRLGWDWFMIPLDNGNTLLVNRYRDHEQIPKISALLLRKDGRQITFNSHQITMRALWPLDNVKGKRLPLRWQVVIPKEHIDLTLYALNRQDWHTFATSYWQGPIEVRGSHRGKGFMRLSGE